MRGIFIYNDFESISFTLVVRLNLLFVSFLSLITISIEKDLVLNNINWNNRHELFICKECFSFIGIDSIDTPPNERE